MGNYNTKVVAVEALEVSDANLAAIKTMLGDSYSSHSVDSEDVITISVPVGQGVTQAKSGDYIVKDQHDQLRVCPAGCFSTFYEAQ